MGKNINTSQLKSKRSLNYRIVRLIVVLVLMTAVVILAAVWNSTSQTVHKNVYGALVRINQNTANEIGHYTADKRKQFELFTENSEHLDLIVDGKDTGYNSAKLIDSLRETKVNLSLDAIFILSENDIVVRSTKPMTLSQEQKNGIRENLNFHDKFFLFINNQLFILFSHVSLTSEEKNSMHPSIILVKAMDTEWVSMLSKKAGLPLTLIIDSRSTSAISSINDTKTRFHKFPDWKLSDDYFGLLNLGVIFGLQHYYTNELTLSPIIGPNASIYVSMNAQRISAKFIEMQSTIGMLALFTVIVAAIFAFFTAQKIVQPIRHLAELSESVSKGEYAKDINIKAYSIELSQLIDSFSTMQNNIHERESQIVYQAQHDMLTALPNRNYAKQCLDEFFKLNTPFQAIIINLSEFRSINDIFGSDLGDACLRILASRIKKLPGDAMRLTGGKFLWLPSQAQNEHSLVIVKSQLEAEVMIEGVLLQTRIAFGLLNCPDDAQNSETVFRRFTLLVEATREAYQDIAKFDEKIEATYLRRLDIITQLRLALASEQGQLSLVYQPKLSFRSHTTDKVEALLRWKHPRLGNVAPDEFIKIAEDAGLIHLVTRWVAEQAMKDAIWFTRSGFALEIAINVSANDLSNNNFFHHISSRLNFYDLNAKTLSFEITETAMLEDSVAIDNLRDFKEAGFNIAIDDFGTGYSSFSYLLSFPATSLKIDKRFVQTLSTSKENKLVCTRMIQIAQDLKLDVIAEGIEDNKSFGMLSDLGCNYGQGYFICRPKDKHSLLLWLGEQKTFSAHNSGQQNV